MENYLNILHYCIYKFEYKLHLISNKLNPILWIYKLPYLKRKFEEKGISDVEKEFNKAFANKENGLSIMVSGGAIIGIVFFLILSLVILLKRLFNMDLALEISHFVFIAVLSIILCYFFIFKNDKYLAYFKKYENWSRTERLKYGWISLTTISLVIILFFISFIL
jgi:hypothetical protein